MKKLIGYNSCGRLDVFMNHLDELILTENTRVVYCNCNNLKTLLLTDILEFIGCDIFVELNNINNKDLKIIFR